ncbi:MAG: metallophosphoesterase family protein [Planctomycetota bacterium]
MPAPVPCIVLAALLQGPPVAEPEAFVSVHDPRPDGVTILWGLVGEDAADRYGEHAASLGEQHLFVSDAAGTEVSPPMGFAPVANRNVFVVRGLAPGTTYSYRIDWQGREVCPRTPPKQFRTWPDPSLPTPEFAFFAFGDYGLGGDVELNLARVMSRQMASDATLQFVLTLGDNIYAGGGDHRITAEMAASYRTPIGNLPGSGVLDIDWRGKFLRPFASLLEALPFFPALGNHDGSDSENQNDLAQHRDNFILPTPPGQPEDRYYTFQYGRDVAFFCLDTTSNAESSGARPAPLSAPDAPQRVWLVKALDSCRAKHRIAYFHHPPFTAGPAHQSDPVVEQLLRDVLVPRGVRVVLCGHEHNYQESGPLELCAGKPPVCCFVSGGGGSARGEDVSKKLNGARLTAFLGKPHVLKCRYADDELVVQLLGEAGEMLQPIDADGEPLDPERVVDLGADSSR